MAPNRCIAESRLRKWASTNVSPGYRDPCTIGIGT
jgi:hypothetical protein